MYTVLGFAAVFHKLIEENLKQFCVEISLPIFLLFLKKIIFFSSKRNSISNQISAVQMLTLQPQPQLRQLHPQLRRAPKIQTTKNTPQLRRAPKIQTTKNTKYIWT